MGRFNTSSDIGNQEENIRVKKVKSTKFEKFYEDFINNENKNIDDFNIIVDYLEENSDKEKILELITNSKDIFF